MKDFRTSGVGIEECRVGDKFGGRTEECGEEGCFEVSYRTDEKGDTTELGQVEEGSERRGVVVRQQVD